MKKLENIVYLIFSFLIGLFLGWTIVAFYEASTFKPWEWKDPPIIVNCYGKELNKDYISKAVNFWKNHGHKIAFIENNPSSEICKKDFIDGFIMIKKSNDLGEETLARTERRVRLLEIRAATIYFEPGTYRLVNIMEHELGHAFGYTHVDIVGHIMHPYIEFMDKKFWIPD